MPQKDILNYTIWIDYEHLMCRKQFSDTYRGINNQTGQDVSVEIIKRKTKNQALQSSIIEQISICQQAISDNIIQIYHIEVTKDSIYFIQQKWDNDLYHYLINQPNGKLSQDRAIQILKDICKGYYQLFRNGIVHRDLKTENIFLCDGVAKIANFNLAIKRHKNCQLSSKCGTPLYISPQIRTGQIVTSKSDIWALGVTFYEMLHGELPWPNGIDDLLSQQQLRLLSYLSPSTKRFLMKCLRIHPKDRLSWDQLFHDPIFEGHFSYKYDEDKELQDKFRFKLKTMKQKMAKNEVSLKQFLKRFEFGNGTQIQEMQLKVLIEEREPGITSKHLQYMINKLDINQDGIISIQDIERQMQRMHTKIVQIDDPLRQKMNSSFQQLEIVLPFKGTNLKGIFNFFDKDKDGIWSFSEFSKFIVGLSEKGKYSEVDLEAIFRTMDRDGRNAITYDDLQQEFNEARGNGEEQYQMWDLEADENTFIVYLIR